LGVANKDNPKPNNHLGAASGSSFTPSSHPAGALAPGLISNVTRVKEGASSFPLWASSVAALRAHLPNNLSHVATIAAHFTQRRGSPMADATMSNVLKKSGKEIHASWTRDLASNPSAGKGRISATELDQQTAEFIKLLTAASEHATAGDISSADFKPVRDFLDGVSRSRVAQGFRPTKRQVSSSL
jgi:hypothetical protein